LSIRRVAKVPVDASSVFSSANKVTVLSMMGTGSFRRKEAFGAVATLPEEVLVFLELFRPTAAHHLGFRVRHCSRDQGRYVLNLGDFEEKLDDVRAKGDNELIL
jgi:hypothetical protein